MANAEVAARLGPRRSGEALWQAGGLLIALAVALPIAAIVWLAVFPSENIWPHLFETVLWDYVDNTLRLMVGVAIGSAVIGVGTAWLVSTADFPGRRLFQWALMLPLAAPTYIVAYVYTDLLEFAGPVQGALREAFGWTSARDYWFPEIRTVGGAIAMMTLTLYPYVYLLSRAAFLEQAGVTREVSRTLGSGSWRTFLRVALPLARPAIVVGVTLALMETLNDFGTVDFFAVRTLTAGVFNVWLTMGNVGGGAQIALVMLGFVVLLILLERLERRRWRYHTLAIRHRRARRQRLGSTARWAAFAACLTPVVLGFLIPGAVLLRNAILFAADSWSSRFADFALNSVLLAGGTAVLCVVLATFLAYAVRLRGGVLLAGAARFASLGYAIPGAVLALGILIPFGAFDNALDGWARELFGVSTGLLLSGTVAAVMFAYVVRFFALSYGALESGLGRIKPSMEMAARTLGAGPTGTLLRVHLPLMKGTLLTAALLIFVDVMKELPATLLLRPFNFDTLATYVYQFGSSEQFELSALGALTIVAVGLVPVVLLNQAVARDPSEVI
ncbi:MAG: iron ABC transporter permease [Alphaproteobacteria bacterium]|nr:iron ABC transporter permease [Alphaproteobacteria bacterium]